MQLTPGLHRVGDFDVEATRRQAEAAGHMTFVLPPDIVDRAAFFDAVRATFPLDPPVMSSHVWDALSDSLFEGLLNHLAQRIAILWPATAVMAAAAAVDFEIALSVLEDVASSLGNPKVTAGPTKDVAILVA